METFARHPWNSPCVHPRKCRVQWRVQHFWSRMMYNALVSQRTQWMAVTSCWHLANFSKENAPKVARRSDSRTSWKLHWRHSTSATTHGSSQPKTEQRGDQLSTRVPKHARPTGLLWLKNAGRPGTIEPTTLQQQPPFLVHTATDSFGRRSVWPVISVPTEQDYPYPKINRWSSSYRRTNNTVSEGHKLTQSSFSQCIWRIFNDYLTEGRRFESCPFILLFS